MGLDCLSVRTQISSPAKLLLLFQSPGSSATSQLRIHWCILFTTSGNLRYMDHTPLSLIEIIRGAVISLLWIITLKSYWEASSASHVTIPFIRARTRWSSGPWIMCSVNVYGSYLCLQKMLSIFDWMRLRSYFLLYVGLLNKDIHFLSPFFLNVLLNSEKHTSYYNYIWGDDIFIAWLRNCYLYFPSSQQSFT